MHQSQTGTQQEVHQKYNPKEQLRFALIIGMDRCSLICGAKAYKTDKQHLTHTIPLHIPVANGCVLLKIASCHTQSGICILW